MALSLRDQGEIAAAQADSFADTQLDFVVQIWSVDGRTIYQSRPHSSLPARALLGLATVTCRDMPGERTAWRPATTSSRSRSRSTSASVWRRVPPGAASCRCCSWRRSPRSASGGWRHATWRPSTVLPVKCARATSSRSRRCPSAACPTRSRPGARPQFPARALAAFARYPARLRRRRGARVALAPDRVEVAARVAAARRHRQRARCRRRRDRRRHRAGDPPGRAAAGAGAQRNAARRRRCRSASSLPSLRARRWPT